MFIVDTSDGSWSKFPWIERDCDFMFHYLREQYNSWMTMFAIFCDFEGKVVNFCVISCEIVKITGIGSEQDFTL